MIGTLSDELGLSKKDYALVGSTAGAKGSKPVSTKSGRVPKLVDKKELEWAYRKCPVIRNAISTLVQIIMAPSYRLVSDDDEGNVDFFEKFFGRIGNRGGETTWQDMIEKIFKYQFIYGDMWVELISDKNDTDKIADLDFIDPKNMDFAKGKNQKIALDSYGNPLGYVQELPDLYGQPIRARGDEPPDKVKIKPNQIFFKPDRIVHFKLDSVGNGFYGLGLIEPVYNDSRYKLNLENSAVHAMERMGFGTRVGYVGNENNHPTKESIEKMLKDLKESTSKTEMALPFYDRVEIMEPKASDKWRDYLQFFIEQQITGLGAPSALVTGSGGKVNRSTLYRQEYILKITLKHYIKRTVDSIEQRILSRIADSYGLDSYPRIQWGEIALEQLNDTAKRLVNYAKSGLIAPSAELARYIAKRENMPEGTVKPGGSDDKESIDRAIQSKIRDQINRAQGDNEQ